MTNIHVKRYPDPKAIGWELTIEPEGRDWIVFVPHGDNPALFFRRVEVLDEEGKTVHAYADVELPGTLPMQHLQPPCSPPPPAEGRGPLDFEVVPYREPMGDAISPADHARERERFPEAREGFLAKLNARAVGCWGETEHEAIRALLNHVVRLAVAGCLDHTGEPMKASSKRRYQAVFGAPDAVEG